MFYHQVPDIEAKFVEHKNVVSDGHKTEADKVVRSMVGVDVFDPLQVLQRLCDTIPPDDGLQVSAATLAPRLGQQARFIRDFLNAPAGIVQDFYDCKGALEMFSKLKSNPAMLTHQGATAFEVIRDQVYGLVEDPSENLQHLLMRGALSSTRASLALTYLRDYNKDIHSYVDLERKVIVLRPTVKTQSRFTELYYRELPLRDIDIATIRGLMSRPEPPLYLFNDHLEPIPDNNCEKRRTVLNSYNKRVSRTFKKYCVNILGNREIRQVRIAHEVLRAYQAGGANEWVARVREAVRMAGEDGHTASTQQKWYNNLYLLDPNVRVPQNQVVVEEIVEATPPETPVNRKRSFTELEEHQDEFEALEHQLRRAQEIADVILASPHHKVEWEPVLKKRIVNMEARIDTLREIMHVWELYETHTEEYGSWDD